MTSDTPYEIPEAVIDAIVDDGKPAEKAFRQHSGVSVAGLAEATDIPSHRLEDIEDGATPTDEELGEIGEALGVPPDLLVDE